MHNAKIKIESMACMSLEAGLLRQKAIFDSYLMTFFLKVDGNNVMQSSPSALALTGYVGREDCNICIQKYEGARSKGRIEVKPEQGEWDTQVRNIGLAIGNDIIEKSGFMSLMTVLITSNELSTDACAQVFDAQIDRILVEINKILAKKIILTQFNEAELEASLDCIQNKVNLALEHAGKNVLTHLEQQLTQMDSDDPVSICTQTYRGSDFLDTVGSIQIASQNDSSWVLQGSIQGGRVSQVDYETIKDLPIYYATVYEDVNFTGRAHIVSRSFADVKELLIGTDMISSIKISSKYKAKVNDDWHKPGTCLELQGDVPDLSKYFMNKNKNWNDVISSIQFSRV